MDAYRILGIVIPNIIINFILFRFCNEVYEPKYKNSVYFMLYTCAVVFQSLAVLLEIPLISLAIFVTIVILLTIFGYSSSAKNKILFSTIYTLYLALIDMVIVPLFAFVSCISVSDTLQDSQKYFITGVLTAIIGLLTYHTVINKMSKRKVGLLTRQQEIFTILLGGFELSMVHMVSQLKEYNAKEINPIVIWQLVGFLFIDIYIIILFESISKNNELREKNRLLEQKGYMDARYYEGLESQNEKYRKIMHDIRKHIYIIRQTKGVDDSYCREVLELLDRQGYRFKCTNQVLNVIINDRLIVCEKEGITVDVKVSDVDLGFMNKMDITTIFLNLIDNAIEACREVSGLEKFIKIKVKELQNHIIVVIENSCDECKSINYVEGVSHKKGHMGLGIANINSVLEEYGSKLDLECKDHLFQAKFIIVKK